MAAFGGVLTPYSAVEFSVTGQQSYRAGAHFELGQGYRAECRGDTPAVDERGCGSVPHAGDAGCASD